MRDEARESGKSTIYDARCFSHFAKKNRVSKADEQKDLIGQLHTLGEIAFYQERDELASLVILIPNG